MKRFVLLSICILVITSQIFAQDFNALKGSIYASSLNVINNPASIKVSPYKWEITPISIQYQVFSNAFTPNSASLLKFPGADKIHLTEGDFERRAYVNADIHLLNTRFAINKKYAVAFGANLRGIAEAQTSSFDYRTSISTVSDFLEINSRQREYSGTAISSSWMELYGSLATILKNDLQSQLNIGVTLKGSLGLSGVNLHLSNTYISANTGSPGTQEFLLSEGRAGFGYSDQFEDWENVTKPLSGIKSHLTNSLTGASIDIGMEYLIKDKHNSTVTDDEDETNYHWKFGFSLLDIGFNRYRYSRNSRELSGLKENISGRTLENKFANPRDILEFNDSLATIVESINTPAGNFKVGNPTRLNVNVDRKLGHQLFINANFTLNLNELRRPGSLNVRQNDIVTITPRWENQRFGFYMPFQYNRMEQLWIGGAVKAGPLVLGLHNLLDIASNKKAFNGGGYVALIFTSTKPARERRIDQADCPVIF